MDDFEKVFDEGSTYQFANQKIINIFSNHDKTYHQKIQDVKKVINGLNREASMGIDDEELKRITPISS